MQFNLIDERWIPVKRRDGTATMIAPWEVADRFADNPVVALNAPRPDFNGALIQFLIGLVQTVAAPKNGAEWQKKLMEPPTSDELHTVFATVRHAFELGGDGPRFMQDFDELAVKQGDIGGLLIDMPGESTTKKNTDHFVKRNTVAGMCPSCCSIALFTMQTNAPSGGQGNRVSLRGGGPLSTLVVGDVQHETLWQLIWLNVLAQKAFLNICGNANLTTDSARFPWLAATRTSEKEDGVSQPNDFHPSLMYWGMPRRIRLNVDNTMLGMCDVCGVSPVALIHQYQQKNFGMNFTGAWLHPLSPYNTNNGGEPLPIHPQPGGVTYRHWLGLVHQDSDDNKMPARIVNEFINNRHRKDWRFRLWAFGYDMKNMNARCWYESRMPLLYIDASIRDDYQQYVASAIKAAVLVGENLRIALKNSIHGEPELDSVTKKIKWKYKDIKKLPADEEKRRAKILFETKEKTALVSVESFFWQNTESQFFSLLNGIKESLETGGNQLKYMNDWLESLCNEAQRLFDIYAGGGAIEDSDPKRVVIARSEMTKFNRSNRVRGFLGL